MTHMKNWAFLAVAAGVFAGVATYHSATHRAARSAARESDLLIRGDPADKAIQARIAVKEAAVKDLIAGRMTLVQTAAVFRASAARGLRTRFASPIRWPPRKTKPIAAPLLIMFPGRRRPAKATPWCVI